MPVYDYHCEVCQKDFEVILSLSEHEKSAIVCPECGGKKIRQLMTTFTAVTSKKS